MDQENDKVLYKKESYEIVGCCFEVFNQLGPGLREKNYQSGLEESLQEKNISFQSQLYVPLKVNDKLVGKYFLDLLVSDLIAIELKAGEHFYRRDIEQLFSYLKSANLKLGILVNFTSSGVKFKRILNTTNYS
jgi:GxxExxY protein